MNGESDLKVLIQNMHPVLVEGEYVFCTFEDKCPINHDEAVMTFKENEGLTVIIERSIADKHRLPYSFIASWITLTVHSSLEAVGLTAVFSNALATENISCNVVAGYYHDHIFVSKFDTERALKVLENLKFTEIKKIS